MEASKTVKKAQAERSRRQKNEVGERRHPQPRAGERCSQGQPMVLPAQEDKDLEYLFPMHPSDSAQQIYGSCSTNVWFFFLNPFN